jgi:DegV family protein with EDD domain
MDIGIFGGKMGDFVITADSNCDLPESYIKENNIGIIPHYYDIDEIQYGDEVNLDPHEFYELMRQGKTPTTVASNPDVIRKTFTRYANEGLDVLHFSFSSALSGGHSNVVCGAKEVSDENPGINITVIDTLNVSLGEGMMVMNAVRMKKEGKTIKEIADWSYANRLNFCVNFVVDDLRHLQRGGRISKTAAVVGTIINVKPLLIVDDEGKLVSAGTVRGRKRSLNAIVDRTIENMGRYRDKKYDLCICHGDVKEDADYVAGLLKEKLGKEDIMINYVSPSIGSHAGPGALGILYMGTKRI